MSYINHHPTLSKKEHSSSKVTWYKQALSGILPENVNSNILEIGPGLGEGLYYLSKIKGYNNVEGVDIDASVVKYCEEFTNTKVHLIDDINNFLKSRKCHFELIIMFHVIEHFEKNEIVKLLKNINEALKSKGTLLIVTPNITSPLIGIDQYYADFTHKTAFSEHSLLQALRMSGYNEITISNFWPPLTSIQKILRRTIQFILFTFYKGYLLLFGAQNSKVVTHQILCTAHK